jgi:hypothetical protein
MLPASLIISLISEAHPQLFCNSLASQQQFGLQHDQEVVDYMTWKNSLKFMVLDSQTNNHNLKNFDWLYCFRKS